MAHLAPDIPTPDKPKVSLLPDVEHRKALRQRRARRDKMSRWGITAAGYGVVLALATIFIYLFYEVAPILRGATLDSQPSYALAERNDETLITLLERYETLGIQYTRAGEVVFFDADNGRRFSAGGQQGQQFRISRSHFQYPGIWSE
jgi:phosphate transport system permease protein